MNQFEYYYQWELDYLRQLAKTVSEEHEHLRDSFSRRDPDVERLNEGFAALMGLHLYLLHRMLFHQILVHSYQLQMILQSCWKPIIRNCLMKVG
ncbi:type VI secretion system baseplate subunit TssF [Xenorhabdus sp. 42]|uniref:type VI secretion system baseplate subunit TssF n=1 Tax=Xenorhabdus szentirmaii TaxID=290112 RepID=UPI0019C27C9C|nr:MULTISPECIES: type VI secretion system baseplate subunit TssF [unclassified Xenorhabdus]MBD2779528.1 type VI secretion system baseplate subunit TssF [Xenorhabdus sp. 38]MBD2820230.1 type VI secretion system baseplate subunit TssF [Xenorhabdus sp. 42]